MTRPIRRIAVLLLGLCLLGCGGDDPPPTAGDGGGVVVLGALSAGRALSPNASVWVLDGGRPARGFNVAINGIALEERDAFYGLDDFPVPGAGSTIELVVSRGSEVVRFEARVPGPAKLLVPGEDLVIASSADIAVAWSPIPYADEVAVSLFPLYSVRVDGGQTSVTIPASATVASPIDFDLGVAGISGEGEFWLEWSGTGIPESGFYVLGEGARVEVTIEEP